MQPPARTETAPSQQQQQQTMVVEEVFDYDEPKKNEDWNEDSASRQDHEAGGTSRSGLDADTNKRRRERAAHGATHCNPNASRQIR